MRNQNPAWYDYKRDEYYLPGLSIWLSVSEIQCIRYEGYVQSIPQRIKEIISESDVIPTDEYLFDTMGLNTVWKYTNVTGGTYIIRHFDTNEINLKANQYIILLRASKIHAMNCFFRAHEETHVVFCLNQMNFIDKCIMDLNVNGYRFNENIPWGKLEPELVADIGGLLGLCLHGYDISNLQQPFYNEHDTLIKEAHEILFDSGR